MFLEVVIYEIATTAAGLLGLRALKGTNLKKRLAGINRPKELPVIDRQLRKYVGHTTKTERYLSRKIASAINRISQYQSFQSILILIGRKFNVQTIGYLSKIKKARQST